MEQKNKVFGKSNFSPPLPDEYFRYVSVWLVRWLRHYPMLKPEHIVLIGFAYKIAGAVLIYEDKLNLAAIFIFIGIILDNVDGMLARATNRVSQLGGAMDLTADIISIVLIYISMGILTGDTFEATLAFASMILTVEAWSLTKSIAVSNKNRQEFSYEDFLYGPIITEGKTRFVRFLNFVYMATWYPLTKILHKIYPEGNALKKEKYLYFFSVGAIGLNQFYLCICLAFNNIELYLLSNIALFPIYIILLLALSDKKSKLLRQG